MAKAIMRSTNPSWNGDLKGLLTTYRKALAIKSATKEEVESTRIEAAKNMMPRTPNCSSSVRSADVRLVLDLGSSRISGGSCAMK